MAIFCTVIGFFVFISAGFMMLIWLHLRGESKVTHPALKALQEQVAAQTAKLDALTEAMTGLRSALVSTGTAERLADLPPPPSAASRNKTKAKLPVIPVDGEEGDERSTPPPERGANPFAEDDATVLIDRPAESTPIEVPRDSEAHGLSLEKMAKLHGERLEDIDDFADAEGLTREEAIKQAILNGIESIEAYAREHQLTREEALKVFMAESQRRYPTPTPTEPINAADHCHGPLCVSGGAACMCSCSRCEPAPR